MCFCQRGSGEQSAGNKTERIGMRASSPFQILIAEDDPMVMELIQRILETMGHVVEGTATNGRQAVELAQSLSVDIVLMDIGMPEMDGLEATRLIQETCPKPVVLLTGHDDPELVIRAGHVGAGAYLVKPPKASELDRAMAIAAARFADLMELRRLNSELQKALAEIRTLRGIVPICAHCKQIRDDKGFWHQVEIYIRNHSDVEFSHGICPDCIKKYYPEYAKDL
jgi:CheY-like chemotaxis protein